ncbi:ABC transporter ATP-binding protein [Ferrovibrio sp.]|uniref:ABC transporter ATP-binding protein n=1 Tax=Ferrovibrio sp. TaxID=1917215 RepID=UPI00311FC862
MSSGLLVRGLAAGYRRRRVLGDIDLPALAPGSLAALIGANGAGKSTLLKALGGLLSASGSARLDDAELFAMPHRQRAQMVGYLPQALPQGSSLVAYEAVLSALRAIRDDLPKAAAEYEVAWVFDTLGLTPLAMRRLDELSGGQRQMVGLAQAIVRKPRLMLLDEPTSALDLRWQLTVLQQVRDIAAAAGSIALIALHDINLALRFCDQVVVLGGGQVLAAGPGRTALSPAILRRAFGVDGRIETCSLGFPVVIADRAMAASLDNLRSPS